ncbi:MAG: cell division protein ZapA [Selenomonadaceae bacterium]|nr:cell division protein ZapA [Selenomonadaceae bacterium]
MAKKTANKEPKRVTVEIYGVSYPLRTDNDEEYVQSIAKMVDEKMQEVATKTGSFLGNKIAVLAALEIADEYARLKKDYDELVALIDEK